EMVCDAQSAYPIWVMEIMQTGAQHSLPARGLSLQGPAIVFPPVSGGISHSGGIPMTKAGIHHFPATFRSGALLVAVIAPLALGGCLPGGDDDDDEDEKGGDGGGEVSTFVGTWSITETGSDGCFDGPFTDTYTITIREENGELVLDDGELVAELEVDGNTASWTLDQSEEGVTAVHTGEATVSG